VDKVLNPALVGMGWGNIRLGTAMKLLSDYQTNFAAAWL
jgi:hypothetical protein